MAINRDVEVRCEIKILSTEVMDENDPSGRGGRRGKVETRIINIPKVIIDDTELIQRASDIADIIQYGYELEGTDPPEAVTEQAGTIAATTAVLHGRILPNVNTSCGFLYGTTKELVSTTNANESPIAAASTTPQSITANLAGLTANTRYYVRAWCQITGLRTRYGRIISFKTLTL